MVSDIIAGLILIGMILLGISFVRTVWGIFFDDEDPNDC